MEKWEYACLVQSRWAESDAGQKQDWLSTWIDYPQESEVVKKQKGWLHGDEEYLLVVTLNRLGSEGWELANLEIYPGVWGWSTRKFWLKRRKAALIKK